MAEKYIKVIQDGRSSLIPDTPFNRAFWTKQNSKASGSQNAAKEMVTIVPASEEEVASMHVVVNKVEKNPNSGVDYESLQRRLDEQQQLINKLLLGNDDREGRNKPGPKPKN